ncbi:60S ribosomal protein L24 [Coemansia sp. RSA 2167]|nr:60S ribosomal protein L24 [Coemansia sp. RSA 2167]
MPAAIICEFSGYKIYPSRGRLYVTSDSKTHRFLSSKTESLFKQRKNNRSLLWTVMYRKVNNKGVKGEVAKKRSRRAVKYNRAVVGASWDTINARRSETTAVRAEAVAKAKASRKDEAAKRKARVAQKSN